MIHLNTIIITEKGLEKQEEFMMIVYGLGLCENCEESWKLK